jgi:hypothetical protein
MPNAAHDTIACDLPAKLMHTIGSICWYGDRRTVRHGSTLYA